MPIADALVANVLAVFGVSARVGMHQNVNEIGNSQHALATRHANTARCSYHVFPFGSVPNGRAVDVVMQETAECMLDLQLRIENHHFAAVGNQLVRHVRLQRQ